MRMRTLPRRVSLGAAALGLLVSSGVAVLGPARAAGADATTFSITANGTSSAAIDSGSSATLAEVGLPNAATGTVTFSNSLNVELCTAVLPVSSCTTPIGLAPGTYSVGAAYSGDGTYGSSTSSNSVSVTVLAPTTTVVSASPASASSGTSVTYSATVTSSFGVPTGNVAFRTTGALLCSAVLSGGDASCTSSTAQIGMDSATAIYAGDASSARSMGVTSVTVFRGSPSLTCARISGKASTSLKFAACSPFSGLNRTASTPGSFVLAGGMVTWSRSEQTTVVAASATSPGQGACPKHFVEHDLTGEVTGGTSLYTLTWDQVSMRVCVGNRTGALRLVAGTTAQL